MNQPVSASLALPSDQQADGRTLGSEELQLLEEVIRSGTLTSTRGPFVKRLESDFAQRYGVSDCSASSSGTAALHVAYASIDPEPGDEFITTPITDMGALTPMLYQGVIPVFADVDPVTLNVTAASIADRISSRTRAIIVTHLFGNPCDMAAIMEVATSHNLPVIEDCSQAFEATFGGQRVGTFGTIGCFSLQQGKHITCGEGGLTITADASLARRIYLLVNKAWGYGDPQPDHYFLALNYRMNEITGAVACAQLKKLSDAVQRRIAMADLFTARIQDLPGITPPKIHPEAKHTYWKYVLSVDPKHVPGGAIGLATRLKSRGIFSAPRYIQKPAFACQIFTQQRTLGTSRFPFTLASPAAIDYSPERFPGTFRGLERVLVLPWNEGYQEEHVDFLANALRASLFE